MIGVDTSYLVAWSIPEHPDHLMCRQLATEAAQQGRQLGLTLGILAEFIHVATDPKRFEQPLTMLEAIHLAHFWESASEVVILNQDHLVSEKWLAWMTQHKLGRKRLLDTLIAATWHCAGITEIYTLNPADFTIFKEFTAYPAKASV